MNSSNKHNNRWRQEDITFLQENYGKISLEDIGEHLGKTPMAVRLYVLRHRLDDRHQVRNCLSIVSAIWRISLLASSSIRRRESTK